VIRLYTFNSNDLSLKKEQWHLYFAKLSQG
jgi:hypothetical protein